ncbi:hypothetical protein Bca52824_023569 [Brassica carinata]|uniref:UBN2 domain-containing protein n=1 Tax=Brassica carinata TaxID=52824 RepID=A0A8X8AVT6_BRACI|nr:hypothetical protein Bca52824_023569 [Brassica carinata]
MQSVSTISSNISYIPTLNGSNFWEWKDSLMIALALMGHDLASREDGPTISDSIFMDTMSDEVVLAKDYLVALENNFVKNDKAETITLLADLVSMKYQSTGSIREHILKISNTASKLKAVGLSLADDVLVCLVLISLHGQFAHFKVSYNCQKKKWNLNELISQCVQEEEGLSKEKKESAHVATTSKGKSPKFRMKKRAADSGHGPGQKKQALVDAKIKNASFVISKVT